MREDEMLKKAMNAPIEPDLVARLRAGYANRSTPFKCVREAADEIERLRAGLLEIDAYLGDTLAWAPGDLRVEHLRSIARRLLGEGE